MCKYDVEKMIFKGDKEIIFRSLVPADSKEYINFSQIIASETTHTLQYPNQKLSIDLISEKFKSCTNSSFHMELGGFYNDVLIAHLSFYIPRPHHPYEKHVGEFGIKIVKDFSSIGLGSAMILRMENIAKKMEVRRLQAKVRTSNHIGIKFYQKHLYEIEGVRKQAAFINGLYEDEFYIAKFLNY